MDDFTLKNKLKEIFAHIGIEGREQAFLQYLYLNPGIALAELNKHFPRGQRMVKELDEKGTILIRNQDNRQSIFPPPLAVLLKNYQDTRKTRSLNSIDLTLKSIDQWLKYPLLKNENTKLKMSKDTDTVIKWLFELHENSWERVFCFGDYESFIDTIGIDTENEWIRERIKKLRKASVVATQDGKWARTIRDNSKEELRDCIINPKEYSDLFIMSFPDITTTVMTCSSGEVTFVYSAAVAENYCRIIDELLYNKVA